MPITGPASYVPTTEAFLNHWTSVNAKMPGGEPLVIPGEPIGFDVPVTRAVLQGLYDSLVTQHTKVQGAVTNADLARDDLGDRKTLMLDKLNQFNEKVRGLLPGTKWERRLPEVPSIGDGRSRFTEAMETASNLWTRINNDSVLGPDAELVLRDSYQLGLFSEALEGLGADYREVGREEGVLGLDREERNDMQDKIYPVLKQYRILMPTFFPPENALVETLPILTPAGGRTPEPVAATGSWDVATQKAKIEWAPSEDEDLDHYEVRWSPGTVYHTDDESTLGTVAADATRSFETDQGLADSGSLALFRVYVVLKSAHEAGSNTVSVTRP